MPCWEVNLICVEFKAANKALLFKALKEQGIAYQDLGNIVTTNAGVTIDFVAQTATYDKSNRRTVDRVNKLKQQYSIEAVKQAAKENKWLFRPTKKVNKFQVVKY